MLWLPRVRRKCSNVERISCLPTPEEDMPSDPEEERRPLSDHIRFALVDAYRSFATFTDRKALYVVATMIKFNDKQLTTSRGEINLPNFKYDESVAFRLLNSACNWWYHIEGQYRQGDIESSCRSEIGINLRLTKWNIERSRKWWNRRAYFKYLCLFFLRD